MTAILLDGEALAARLRADLSRRRARLGLRPRMVMVLVEADPASRAYLARKAADGAETGMQVDLLELPSEISRSDLLKQVARLNQDPDVDGFFVQFPLPAGHDPAEVSAAIDPAKDIDGLGPVSLGRMMAGLPGLRPTTPAGVLALLQEYRLPLVGRHVVVIGRGALVGRPLALLLAGPQVGAAVTVLHRQVPDLARHCRGADVVISAAGMPGLVQPGMIRPGAAVIGAGISYDAAGGMLSDLGPGLAEIAGHITPHPGAIGALTRAKLLENLLEAAQAKAIGGLPSPV